MNALTKHLYPVPAPRTTGGIFLWWERRRVGYNLLVGAAGLVSLIYVDGAALLLGEGLVPWQPVLVFGVLANVCYLLGPVAETLAYRLLGDDLLPVGPALYRMGLTFSVGLALFPALLVTLVLLVKLFLLPW